jgi:hypothetical protein
VSRKFPSLEMVTKELDAVGVQYDVENSKHFLIKWTYNGQRRLVVTPRNGSDHRGPMNARKDVRRILRQDGLIAAKGARH